MGLMESKKGFLITLIAVLISVLLFVAFSYNLRESPDSRNSLVESRISLLNSFVTDFFSFSDDASAISGYFAFQGILKEMHSKHYYMADFEKNFTRCIRNGNFSANRKCPGMENKSLEYFLDKMTERGYTDLKINATYKINFINITQADAFAANLTLNLTVNITDSFANIIETKVIVRRISFEGLLDPLYLINGSYNQTIRQIDIGKKLNWNAQDLQMLWRNQTYRNTPLGVSFFDRIRGNFKNSSKGIESYVNYTLVYYTSDPFDENDSMVDYYFWRKIKFNCTNHISGSAVNDRIVKINYTAIPLIDSSSANPNFQLDDVHRVDFRIASENTSFTC